MKSILFRLSVLLAFLHSTIIVTAQNFPQQEFNNALQNRFAATNSNGLQTQNKTTSSLNSGVKQLLSKTTELLLPTIKLYNRLSSTSLSDTIFVGVVPNDTLVITGTFFNNGPILVFNDGVLIFDNANATILGDLFVFQDGKMIANNSTLAFPQLYFYQRSWILAHNGSIEVSNCTLDFTGLSHNLVLVNNSHIEFHNVQNLGFTTTGAYENASLLIDTINQAGEFIMTDSASFTFNNANTILLWHTVPANAGINMSFPAAGTVANYSFNSTTPGVTGLNYNVQLSNCTDVMWALMPSNGSNVNISGSTIRAIGLWFENGDTVNVSGLVNNSTYTNFLAPLNDRVLQLNNCSVQTWSLYTFDTSSINITGCIIGEVGSMGKSFVTAQGILCDGTGGYYWTSDTSFSIAISSTVFSSIRSQGNGIFLFGYGSVNGAASAVSNAVLIVTQSSLPQDPVAYDHSAVWLLNIDPLPVSYVNNPVAINGSAWIDQGPLGSFMDFGSYELSYSTSANPSAWIPISSGNVNEVHHALLATWNTNGLSPGAYNLRLNTFNNLGDSIDAIIQVSLLPSILGVEDIENEISEYTFSPNPVKDQFNINFMLNTAGSSSIKIYDTKGKLVYEIKKSFGIGKQSWNIDPGFLNSGIYHFEFQTPGGIKSDSFVVTKD